VSAATERSRCDRARAWAALAPDGELAMLESRLLESHLAHCADCRRFAEQVTAIAAELRAAAVERSLRRLVLTAAPAPRSAHARIRSVASVAAVAAMALGIAMQAPAGDPERPSGPPAAAPPDVDDAELHTIRRLRREATLTGIAHSRRASCTVGTQPA
jgi:ferric-dicitrate binding protein FerR (iron transport regulator)